MSQQVFKHKETKEEPNRPEKEAAVRKLVRKREGTIGWQVSWWRSAIFVDELNHIFHTV